MDLSLLLNPSIDHGELSQELNTGFQERVEAGGGWGNICTLRWNHPAKSIHELSSDFRFFF